MSVSRYTLCENKDKHRVYLRKIEDLDIPSDFNIDNAGKVMEIVSKVFDFKHLAEEEVHAVYLNAHGQLLGVSLISKGGLAESYVTLRSLFIRAMLLNASGFVLIHNHPSMDCHPSKEDINLTQKLKDMGSIMGVFLLDHIIVGNGYKSFVQESLL